MSEPANLFDDIHAAAEERADQEAEADVVAGRIEGERIFILRVRHGRRKPLHL